uniref:Integrase catalytic domain-containing protein n=1 Tax=Glossina pallidipes TaxID=7398 RepID=A0A1B0AFX0_GLOPL
MECLYKTCLARSSTGSDHRLSEDIQCFPTTVWTQELVSAVWLLLRITYGTAINDKQTINDQSSIDDFYWEHFEMIEAPYYPAKDVKSGLGSILSSKLLINDIIESLESRNFSAVRHLTVVSLVQKITYLQMRLDIFGASPQRTSDQRAQYTSKLFAQFTHLLGSHNITTPSHHSQANGEVEGFYGQLKATFTTRDNASKGFDEIPVILLEFRSVYKEDISATSAETHTNVALYDVALTTDINSR